MNKYDWWSDILPEWVLVLSFNYVAEEIIKLIIALICLKLKCVQFQQEKDDIKQTDRKQRTATKIVLKSVTLIIQWITEVVGAAIQDWNKSNRYYNSRDHSNDGSREQTEKTSFYGMGVQWEDMEST